MGVPRALLGLACALALALAVSCGNGDSDQANGDPSAVATPEPVTEDEALEIYLGEMEKLGWFYRDDPVDIETEYLLIADAQAKTTDLGLSLYATVPGPPPYPEGLPGWFIVARGDFYEVTYPETPAPGTRRRPGVSTAFVDLAGRFTYGMKFTDATPAATPAA